jgi:hypothetical protein
VRIAASCTIAVWLWCCCARCLAPDHAAHALARGARRWWWCRTGTGPHTH